MSELRYQAGLSNVGSYQISGIPWASSSISAPISSGTPANVEFPFITKSIIVKNTGASGGPSVKVGFSENGVKGTNYFLLAPSESFAADLRVTNLYVLSAGAATTVSIIAGLTGIAINNLPTNWSGSVGVG
jgi:hypothetical protein